MRYRALAVGVAVALGVLASFAATQPALAVGCYASSCTGQDPNDMGCGADAKTIDSFNVGANFYVELRYSGACHAAWTRVTNTWYSNGGSQNLFVEADGYPFGCNSSCAHVYEAQQAFFGTDWTNMVTFEDWVRACEVNWPGPPLNPVSDCTSYH